MTVNSTKAIVIEVLKEMNIIQDIDIPQYLNNVVTGIISQPTQEDVNPPKPPEEPIV